MLRKLVEEAGAVVSCVEGGGIAEEGCGVGFDRAQVETAGLREGISFGGEEGGCDGGEMGGYVP